MSNNTVRDYLNNLKNKTIKDLDKISFSKDDQKLFKSKLLFLSIINDSYNNKNKREEIKLILEKEKEEKSKNKKLRDKIASSIPSVEYYEELNRAMSININIEKKRLMKKLNSFIEQKETMYKLLSSLTPQDGERRWSSLQKVKMDLEREIEDFAFMLLVKEYQKNRLKAREGKLRLINEAIQLSSLKIEEVFNTQGFNSEFGTIYINKENKTKLKSLVNFNENEMFNLERELKETKTEEEIELESYNKIKKIILKKDKETIKFNF